MEFLHTIIFFTVLLVVLLGGIPATIYFLTKYDKQLYSELVKFRTSVGSPIATLLAFVLGKYLTPAFYIFVPILFIITAISHGARWYKMKIDAIQSKK